MNRPRTRKVNGAQDATWSYDGSIAGKGYLTASSDAAGSYDVLAYDELGRAKGEIYGRAQRFFAFLTYYDGLGQVSDQMYPDGRWVHLTPDSRGYFTGTGGTSPIFISGVEWDAQGRLSQWIAQNGVKETAGFDPITGRLASIAVKSAGGTDLEKLSYIFDPGDRLTGITDVRAPSRSRSYTYDFANRLKSATGPYPSNGLTLFYAYDSIGNMLCKDSASATVCSGSAFGYPIPGSPRPHAALTVNGQPATYGSTGNLETLGTRQYGYDPLGQLRSIRDNTKLLASYDYDASGQRARVVDQGGPQPQVVRHLIRPDFEWDETHQLGKIHLLLGGATVATHVFAFALPPTTPMASPWARDWPLSVAVTPAAAAALLLGLQLLRLRQRKTAIARPALAGGTIIALLAGFAPPASALVRDGDLNGDGRVDAADVLLAHRIATGKLALTATYLEHGDVAPQPGARDYQINAGDVAVLLRGVRGDDVDGDGLAGAAEAAAGTSRFTADSDGDGLSDGAEVAAGTDPLMTDTDEDGYDDQADASPRTGVIYRHTDHLGSPVLTTRSNGDVVTRLAYRPFGNILFAGPGYSLPTSIGFTSQRTEPNVGLYDYGARFYDPTLGRFLQPDSVVPEPYRPQSLNRYSYVENDPVNRIDPSGNQSFEDYFGLGRFREASGLSAGLPPVQGDPGSVSAEGSYGPGSNDRGPGSLLRLVHHASSGSGGAGALSPKELIQQTFGGLLAPWLTRVGGTAASEVASRTQLIEEPSLGVLLFPEAGHAGPPQLFPIDINQSSGGLEFIAGPVRALGVGRGLIRAKEALGFFPSKLGGGATLQPFSRLTGRWVPYGATLEGRVAGLSVSRAGSFVAGAAQGLMSGYSGVDLPPAINQRQAAGQYVGSLAGSLLGYFY